ncbi:MAG TPA: S8 family serine peptidase [Vicinamibacterales bacterium]|nr:S8 family serine peptidase [Vicinamibacterales bacterium]
MVRPFALLSRILMVAASLLLAATPVSAGPDRLDRALQAALKRRGGGRQPVIVRLASSAHAETLRRALVRHGDRITAEYPGLGALVADVHTEDLAGLAAARGVVGVSLDAAVVAQARRDGPDHRRHDSLHHLGVLRATLGLGAGDPDGAGVGVAIVDSGIQPSIDFGDRIAGFWDLTRRPGAIEATRPYDDFGHGTHVAGLVAGSGLLSGGRYMGVAPGATLYGFKVLDGQGTGRTSAVIAALDFLVRNGHDRRYFPVPVRVINLSLGHPPYESFVSDPLVQAVEAAVGAGYVVVTSAGNFGALPEGGPGYGGITSPGTSPSAVTVGALRTNGTVEREDDTVPLYSSRGPTWFDGLAKPDLVAPGDQLVSDASRGSLLSTSGRGGVRGPGGPNYLRLSGTSMAAAVTSGAAALVVAANPALTPARVKAILQFTAIPLETPVYDPLVQGTGGLNAGGAVTAASAIRMTAAGLSAPVVPEPVTVIGRRSYVWSQALIWGPHLIAGGSVTAANIVWGGRLLDENIVWGTGVVWGAALDVENIVWGGSILWVENIVWGTGLISTVDGEPIAWGAETGENIVWGTLLGENIVWGGGLLGENIVWGTRQP